MKKLILLASLVLSINAIAQIPTYVPTTGLVAWYPFNGNANDESGNGNNGTNNGATLTTDRNGNVNSAYYFSSAGCATRIDATINTTSIQTGLTISIWVMKVGDGCLGPRLLEFANNDGPGTSQYTWDNSSSLISVGSLTSTGFVCVAPVSVSPNNNIWTNIIYTNDGTFGRIYINGVLDTAISSTGNPILSGNAAFGRMNHPAYDAFNGKLDDIGIWNRGLTEQEVITLYNGCTTCTTPINITATSITGSKATISWTGNSCAAKYRVRYRLQGTTSWVTKVVTAPVSTKILTLLQPLTTYEYQVRTDCNSTGTIASAYSTIQTFTTICDCTKPTNIAVSNVSQTAATVSWVGNVCALKYRLQYRVQGTAVWTTKTITAPTVTKTLTGLTANTIYEYRLRTDCNSTGTVNSGWTTTATITTTLKLEETEISSSTFYVSPNPCSTCFVNGSIDEKDLIVTDIVGRKANVQFTISENGFYINLSENDNGFFLIRNIKTGEVAKFVKE